MGAAISLQATAVSPNLCAVVVESPYSTFREIAYDRVARHGNIPVWMARTIGRPSIEIALLYTRLRYGVDLSQANPQDGLANSRVPTLLLHGTTDENIPLRHSYSIMQVAGSHAQLWEVQGANHGGAVTVAPAEFENRVIDWLQMHASSRTTKVLPPRTALDDRRR